jgi:hypothetical protein
MLPALASLGRFPLPPQSLSLRRPRACPASPPDDSTRRIQLLVGRLLDSTRVRASSLLAPSIAQTFKYAADCCSRTFARACNFRATKYYSPDNHQPELEYVPYHRSCVSSSRIHCCIFGTRLIPLRLAESARRAAEGFVGRPCYGKFHGSFRQRSGGHLSGSSLRSGRARSRPSGRVPDVKKLDHRLQSDHSLVRTLCQPDDRRSNGDRDIRRPEWSPDKGARHGDFPAHLNCT